MSITTHALTPSAVLQVHAQLRPVTPPAFVLCIRGDHFELGEGPGEAARTHLQAARAHLAECLALPDALAWRQWQTQRRGRQTRARARVSASTGRPGFTPPTLTAPLYGGAFVARAEASPGASSGLRQPAERHIP
ncbi:MAG: hypothetical protein IPJ73_00940 [Zoogloea sp.]|nr:hypothetical protein [Zoogloea sp.]